MHHENIGEGINLGRFRLSVSGDVDGERERIAAKKVADPWGRLAAAYRLLGDQAALCELLKRHPTAASGIDDLFTS